jgi:hypothetical protein
MVKITKSWLVHRLTLFSMLDSQLLVMDVYTSIKQITRAAAYTKEKLYVLDVSNAEKRQEQDFVL